MCFFLVTFIKISFSRKWQRHSSTFVGEYFRCLAQGLHRRNFWYLATPCLVVGDGLGMTMGMVMQKPLWFVGTTRSSRRDRDSTMNSARLHAVFINMCTLHTHIIRYTWDDPEILMFKACRPKKQFLISTLKVNSNPCFGKSWHLRLLPILGAQRICAPKHASLGFMVSS